MPKITDITEPILRGAPQRLMAARADLDAVTVDAGDGVEAHQVVVELE